MTHALNTVSEMLQRVDRNLQRVGNKEEISRSDEMSRSKLEERVEALEKRLAEVEQKNLEKMTGLAEAVRRKLEEISRSKN